MGRARSRVPLVFRFRRLQLISQLICPSGVFMAAPNAIAGRESINNVSPRFLSNSRETFLDFQSGFFCFEPRILKRGNNEFRAGEVTPDQTHLAHLGADEAEYLTKFCRLQTNFPFSLIIVMER
eukprot:gb/GEZN01010272.1/.p1 GENE.gb/GEZN01010272.1/~~gb/GEZN01010272.1/.p1  ORF type:complete len:124 (+),score=4.04 gb/GEZN01010272.1/:266-637(+)